MKATIKRSKSLLGPDLFSNPEAIFEKNLELVSDESSVDEDRILGYTLFKVLTKVLVPVSDLPSLWLNAGLPERYLPSAPHPNDVFLKATREFHIDGRELLKVELHNFRSRTSKGEEVVLNGTYSIRLLVRNVASSGDEIVRHVVREIVDENGKALVHGTVVELVWDKENQKVTILKSPEIEGKQPYKRLEENFWKMMEVYKTNFDQDTLQYMVRNVIADHDGMLLLSQKGHWYVPRKHEWVAKALKEFYDSLRPYAVSKHSPPKFYYMRTVNGPAERDLVADSFVLQAAKQVAEILKEIKEKRDRGESISRTVLKRYRAQRQMLESQLEYYRQLLGASLESAALSLAHLDAQLKTLDP